MAATERDKQYGVIPFIRGKKRIRVVLITSAGGQWIFPKGRYEADLGKAETAKLEAYEEAGLKGRICRKIKYKAKVRIKSGEWVRLTLYPLEVSEMLDEWPEQYRRERKVVGIPDARKMIGSVALASCLDKFTRDFLADS